MFTAISSPILPLAPTPPGRTEPAQTTTAITPAITGTASAVSSPIPPGSVFSVHPPDTTTRATALDNGPLRSAAPEDRARRKAASAAPRHLFEAVIKEARAPIGPPAQIYEESAAIAVDDPAKPTAHAHPPLLAEV